MGGIKKMVGGKGIEPLRPCGHQILSLARLPVPPLAREDDYRGGAENAAPIPGSSCLL